MLGVLLVIQKTKQKKKKKRKEREKGREKVSKTSVTQE
jgi:hypothetical protein